jgi:secreted trypsin-like serine protease
LNEISEIKPVRVDKSYSPGYTSLTELMAIGFGVQYYGGEYTPSTLQDVAVKYVEQDVCQTKYAFEGEITDAMMCAGEKGKDGCQGDSGEFGIMLHVPAYYFETIEIKCGVFCYHLKLTNSSMYFHYLSPFVLLLGGPLYDAEKDVVVGVTSWGVGCGSGKLYSVRFAQLFWYTFNIHHICIYQLNSCSFLFFCSRSSWCMGTYIKCRK